MVERGSRLGLRLGLRILSEQARIQDFSQGWAPSDGMVLECYLIVHFEWRNSASGVGARPSAHPLDPRLVRMGLGLRLVLRLGLVLDWD